jgi:hypothetical protein
MPLRAAGRFHVSLPSTSTCDFLNTVLPSQPVLALRLASREINPRSDCALPVWALTVHGQRSLSL